jgi:hypothetical protein
MTIQYYSDLHLEFKANKKHILENPLIPVGDILILAGNIILFSKINNHNDSLDYISENFAITFSLPGNLGYYYSDISNRPAIPNEKIRKNLSVVNNCGIEYGGASFLLSTLWSLVSQTNKWRV